MLKLSGLCLATLMLLQSPVGYAQAIPVSDLAARIDAAIAPYYKANEPGATVIVVRDGKTVFRKAYGMADVVAGKPMTPDMVLRLGSITKQITSTAILMLAEEGKLALSDDITKFLPDYPTGGKTITIEHLLTHTSGIVSYTNKPGFAADSLRDLTVKQMIDSFKNDPLEFAPGSRFNYNNSGYFLLGAIIEKVSGKPYAQFVAERIFVPLGMEHTAYEGFERVPVIKASGHSRTATGYGPSKPLSMSQPYAAGALESTVDDLARWDAAVSAHRLISAASWQRAFTPYKLPSGESNGYAYGWQTGTLQGMATVGHGGGINGFSTYALRVPEAKVYVAILTNNDGAAQLPTIVSMKAAAIAAGKPFPEYKEIALDPASLDAFAGVYKIDDKTSRVLRRDKDKLTMMRTGGTVETVHAYAPNAFFFDFALTSMEFEHDASGKVNGLRIVHHVDGKVESNPRMGDAPPARASIVLPAAVLDTYAGRYAFTPSFSIELSRDGERFLAQATGQPKLEALAASETVFFAKDVDAELEIEKTAGKVTGLVLRQGGRTMPAKKID